MYSSHMFVLDAVTVAGNTCLTLNLGSVMESQFQLSWVVDFLRINAWMVQVFIVVFVVVVLNYVLRRVLRRLHKKFELTPNPWDDAFIEALERPLTILAWIVGLAFAATIVEQETGAVIFQAVKPLRDVGVIAVITWFLVRLVKRVQHNIIRQREAAGESVDHTTVEVIAKLLRLSLIITASLVTMQTLGYSISGVLAFGGVGGIAIGFAAKDLLANFFGAMMIYLDRPFAVGDWVRSPDRDIEGTVENIGWRLTLIRTFDKRPLYVPNATFASIAVENPSRMSHRRIYETIGIRYDDNPKMGVIVRDVEAMLKAHPEIDDSQTLMVNFNRFAASSLDFFVYAFTHTTNWQHYHKVKQDVLLRISDIIQTHGAEIAFPTSTVHVPGAVQVENTEPAVPAPRARQ